MTEAEARDILGDMIQADGGLDNLVRYVNWYTSKSEAVLDGSFTADELEAIAWWMRKNRNSVTDAAPALDE